MAVIMMKTLVLILEVEVIKETLEEAEIHEAKAGAEVEVLWRDEVETADQGPEVFKVDRDWIDEKLSDLTVNP